MNNCVKSCGALNTKFGISLLLATAYVQATGNTSVYQCFAPHRTGHYTFVCLYQLVTWTANKPQTRYQNRIEVTCCGPAVLRKAKPRNL